MKWIYYMKCGLPQNQNYVTLYHNHYGSHDYDGVEDLDEVYKRFLKDPDSNTCKQFDNKLSDAELGVLNSARCIIFVVPAENWLDRKYHDQDWGRDKVAKFIKKSIREEHLIDAYGVRFDNITTSGRLKNAIWKGQSLKEIWNILWDNKIENSLAIIEIESIMNVPFEDKTIMKPGNIFISHKGEIIKNNQTVDDCIHYLKLEYKL